ncbi:protein translocase subunit SecD [Candidatus Dependentiae bacterium]|nr:protein translocase subunit SecD [Candidatus Dependentiae bacterium]
MTLSSRPLLLLNIAFWLAISAYGAYFLVHMKSKRLINLGIDLVGGLYLTLDVKVEEAIKNDLMSSMQLVVDKLKKDKKELPGVPTVDAQKLIGTLTFSTSQAAFQARELARAHKINADITQEDKVLFFSFSQAQIEKVKNEAIESNISVLRTRLDALGSGEVTIIKQGDRHIVIELPNERDPEAAKARIGTAAVLEMKEVYDIAQTREDLLAKHNGKLPEGTTIAMGKPNIEGEDQTYFAYLVPAYAKITGKQLRDSRYLVDSQNFLTKSTPHQVGLEFNAAGAEKFYELTKANVGGHVAILLDNVVVSAPGVNGPIEGGSGQISGNFTEKGAKELVALLKSGAFSAPVEVVEERQIGPSLGEESIHKGLVSCGIALVLLFLFSVVVYKVAGLYAFIVLLFNLLLILLGLSLVPDATLTLPGIAGMVLTVGMAIDSSILIYERIKEELAAGMSMRKAVNSGFAGATSVILDANITTFIVGVVLYYFGSPSIQGFALTMMLGILSTLITGLVLLKTLFNISFDIFGIQKIKI